MFDHLQVAENRLGLIAIRARVDPRDLVEWVGRGRQRGVRAVQRSLGLPPILSLVRLQERSLGRLRRRERELEETGRRRLKETVVLRLRMSADSLMVTRRTRKIPFLLRLITSSPRYVPFPYFRIYPD